MTKKTYYVLNKNGDKYWSPDGWVKNLKNAAHMSWEDASEGLKKGDMLLEKQSGYFYTIV